MAARVEIYTSAWCGYCTRAKRLLEGKNVTFEEFGVDMDGAKRQEMIERSGGRRTVPQIFVDGLHVGGCDELYALDREGRLDALLAGGNE